jgi:hypothetical protein
MGLKNFIILHGIAACILLFAFTPAHALEAMEPCANPPSDEWELLSAPPPESEQMLAITLKPQANRTPGVSAQKEAWLHSKNGGFRLCRNYEPTDQCYTTQFTDFHRRDGQWYVASAGTVSHCPLHPQKCVQSPYFEDTGSRPAAKDVSKTAARTVALRTIAERLSKEWVSPSRDIYGNFNAATRREGFLALLY